MVSENRSLAGLDTKIGLCLFGASPDTGNLGVSALFLSVLSAIADRYPAASVTVFDYGRGIRDDEIDLSNGTFRFRRCGANYSRRYYRQDSLLNMRVSAAFGGLGNPGIKAIAEADAVLDVSGGDSFADLYGKKRFEAITQTKRLVIDLGTPLVLLPQTYGPFEQPGSLQIARQIVRDTDMAWARDARSFDVLRELLGEAFDPAQHCLGVDLAFALPPRETNLLTPMIKEWVTGERTSPVIGFNVSGLICNHANAATEFGMKADYADLVRRILQRLLEKTDARIVLVPHVIAPPGHYESDLQASKQIAASLSNERVAVLEETYDAMEIKWVISQLDFFCGTRMHSTIASLSSGVPTAAIAYSDKTRGVFETCGQGACVIDPRSHDIDRCIDDFWQVWVAREKVAKSLKAKLPDVLAQATRQNSRIFDYIEARGSKSIDPRAV